MTPRRVLNIIILIVIVCFTGLTGYLVWFQISEISTAVAFTLIITFIGVFAAQILAQSFIDVRNEALSFNILLNIRQELETTISFLTTCINRNQPFSVPTDAWDLAVNSGRASYFENNRRNQLFNVYRLIRLYNLRSDEYNRFFSNSVLTGEIDKEDVAPFTENVILAGKAARAISKAILAMGEWPGGETSYDMADVRAFAAMFEVREDNSLVDLLSKDWSEVRDKLNQLFESPNTEKS